MTEILFLKTRTKSIWRYYHNYDKRLCYCQGFPHYWLVCIDKLSLNLVYAFYCYQSLWLTTFLLSLIVCCLCAHLPLTFWLLHRKLTIELILTKLISQHRWLPCPVIGWDIFTYPLQPLNRFTKLDGKQYLRVRYQTYSFSLIRQPWSLPSPLGRDIETYFWLHLCTCWKGFGQNMTGSKH